jgi:hypothetical protein
MWTINSTCRNLSLEITRIFTAIKARVMITKLTLTLNQEVIDSAKAYAKRNGKSLSAIVENYLRLLNYLPILMVTGLIAGLFIAWIAKEVLERLRLSSRLLEE